MAARKDRKKPDTTIRGPAQDIDNIIISTEQGIISASQLEYHISEYINKLPVPDMVYKNSNTFNGLLMYLYSKVIRQILPDNYKTDYILLDSIFQCIYIPLCSYYGFNPSVYSFIAFMRISSATITMIRNDINTVQGYSVYNNKRVKDIIDGWYDISKSLLMDKAITAGNPAGAIFILKSIHGLQDNTTVRIETGQQNAERLSIDELDAIAQEDAPPQLETVPEDLPTAED